MLGLIIAEFTDIVLLPHVLSEASSLARQIDKPAWTGIQAAYGVQRDEFYELGLTDAVILHLCNTSINGVNPTLVTVDADLVNSASSLGYSVIDYRDFQNTLAALR